MRRFAILATATALVLQFSLCNTNAADPPAQKLGRYLPSEDSANKGPLHATTEDIEQIRHRSYYGPSHYSYRPYYSGFSYGYSSYYYTPRYYSPPVYYSYYAPRYYAPQVYYYPTTSYYGGYCGIGGGANSGVTLSLNLRPNWNPEPLAIPESRPRPLPSPIQPGTFRYDGGPSNPVPMPPPQQNGNPQPAPAEPPPAILAPRPTDDSLKIAFKREIEPKKTENRFKAYGEK
jgi:hypothetical protein